MLQGVRIYTERINMSIFHNPDEVRERLSNYGIDYDDLVEAVLRGHGSRGMSSELHPSNYAGTLFHANTIEALRDLVLKIDGWEMDEPKNLSVTINTKTDVCIVVASGNQNTGNRWMLPKTRSKKGAFFEAAVLKNSGEIPMRDLFETEEEYNERLQKIETRKQALSSTVLYLLINSHEGTPKAELSRPVSYEDGWVKEWSERNILDLSMPRGGDSDDTREEDYDIPVTFRK